MGIFIKELSAESMSLQEYLTYVESCQEKLPVAAYDYAKASWHYDMTDPRCIHDAWLLSFTIKEASLERPERDPERFEMEISFLSAFENRVLNFAYKDVIQYRLETPAQIHAHSEVYFDEIRLSAQDNVVHEILFMSNVRWVIEARDFVFSCVQPWGHV
jgi:hypothetical protein